jgi:hypothetical protein
MSALRSAAFPPSSNNAADLKRPHQAPNVNPSKLLHGHLLPQIELDPIAANKQGGQKTTLYDQGIVLKSTESDDFNALIQTLSSTTRASRG